MELCITDEKMHLTLALVCKKWKSFINEKFIVKKKVQKKKTTKKVYCSLCEPIHDRRWDTDF